MKYIRTKDTIFAVVDENSKVLTVRAKSNPHHLYNKSKMQTEIVAQADTIEELCDVFVFHTLDGYEQHFLSQGHLEDVLSNKNIDLQDYLSCREIYGAIWTDKGLIYVAKMNEKGELELL